MIPAKPTADDIDKFVADLRAKGMVVTEGKPVHNVTQPPVGTGLIRKSRVSSKPAVRLIEPKWEVGFNSVTMTLPLKLEPVSNNGSIKKWLIGQAARHRRVVTKMFAAHVADVVFLIQTAQRGEPVYCTITRIGRMMDDDGLEATAKWVRDTVALYCGVDDNPKGPIKWKVDQKSRMVYGTIVNLSLSAPSTEPTA